MARPRFLDALQPAHRAEVEPLLREEVRAGRSLAELVAWAKDRGLKVEKTAMAEYRREVLGGASEDATARVQRQVAAPASSTATPSPGTLPSPHRPPAAPGAAFDFRAELLEQLERARHTARTEHNANARNAADKLILDITERLRDLDKEVKADQGPRVVFYFPEKVEVHLLESAEP